MAGAAGCGAGHVTAKFQNWHILAMYRPDRGPADSVLRENRYHLKYWVKPTGHDTVALIRYRVS
jgi:hypothetical protein